MPIKLTFASEQEETLFQHAEHPQNVKFLDYDPETHDLTIFSFRKDTIRIPVIPGKADTVLYHKPGGDIQGLVDAYLNRYPDKAHFIALSDCLQVRLIWLEGETPIAATTLYTTFDTWNVNTLPVNAEINTDDRAWQYWPKVLGFLLRTRGPLRVASRYKGSVELTDGANTISLIGRVEDEIVFTSKGMTPPMRYDVANAYTEAVISIPDSINVHPFHDRLEFSWTTNCQDITVRRQITLNQKEDNQ